MSEQSSVPNESVVPPKETRAPSRWGLQIGLRSLFLLLTSIAVWVTYWNNRRGITATRSRIEATRPLVRELVVEDPQKIAVVKLEEMWYDENRWDVHLPSGKYRLCVATREVGQADLAPVTKSEPLAAGRHQIQIEQQRVDEAWRVTITWDGTGRLTVDEPKEWDPGHGSSGGGEFSQSTSLPADKPVVLFRRRFSQSMPNNQFSTPPGPTEGILLWIEPVK